MAVNDYTVGPNASAAPGARRTTRDQVSTDRVSVCLATHNGARYLQDQLDSLANQCRLPDELVVVDDSSSDDTVDILRRFSRTAPFEVSITVMPDRVGTGEAFTESFVRSSGDILFICDQDDIWHEHKISLMTEAMVARDDALMAFSDATLIGADGVPLSRSRWRIAGFSRNERERFGDDPLAHMVTRPIVSGCTTAVRRELLEPLLPFPANIHPALGTMIYDRWISLVGCAAAPVLAIPERLVHYRIHPGQQVGIPGLPFRRIAPRVMLHLGQFSVPGSVGRDRRAYTAAHLDVVQKRLEAADMDSATALTRLDLARRHLRFRQSVPRSRPQRLRPVLGELSIENGYRRFSMGLSAALADLLR